MVQVQQKHCGSRRKQLHLLDAISYRDMRLQMSPEERAASSPARTRSNKVRRKCVAVTQTKHVPNGSVFVTSPKLTLSQGTAPERRRCRDGARLHYQNATTAQWRRLDYRHCGCQRVLSMPGPILVAARKSALTRLPSHRAAGGENIAHTCRQTHTGRDCAARWSPAPRRRRGRGNRSA